MLFLTVYSECFSTTFYCSFMQFYSFSYSILISFQIYTFCTFHYFTDIFVHDIQSLYMYNESLAMIKTSCS